MAPRILLPTRSVRLHSSRAIGAPLHHSSSRVAPIGLTAPYVLPNVPTIAQQQHAARFSTGNSLFKKAGKANLSHSRTDSSPPVSDASRPTAADEAFDLSTLEAGILKAIERLTHDLAQLRAGGRFNPDVLEALRVQVGKGKGKETAKIGELAQVVPRGRVVNVIVGEQEHIKPITAAILASPYSLTPQAPDPGAPLTIVVPIPPPTGESRKAALEAAHKAAEVASTAIQDARAVHHKKLRRFQVERSVRPDDLQKANKSMEEVVKRGVAEVRRIADGAKRVLEGSA